MLQRISLFLKGIAMGAADVVPGVSGGTIAFITGIYEELLQSIKGVNLGLLLLLCSGQPGCAREVVAQHAHLRRVPPETLIETGLRAPDLIPLGHTAARVRADTLATDAQLSLLGFF